MSRTHARAAPVDSVVQLTGLSRYFGALKAVDEVSLDVRTGTCHALIGPNGAGKSTLLNLIGGSVRPSAGEIQVMGRIVTSQPESSRAGMGLARTFQNAQLFDSLDCLRNVLLAVQRHRGGAWSLRLSRARREQHIDAAMARLHEVGLDHRAATDVGELSHGERRQLEIGLALACDPSVILLDEPTAGMSPAETSSFVDLITSLRGSRTFVLVEHDMHVVARLADKVTVLAQGKVIAEGTPQEVRDSELVQSVYLAGSAAQELGLDGRETLR